MAIQTGKSGNSRMRTTQSTLSEINVTPLVDVMLVLLIVFMVSAPLMQQGIQVDLPKTNSTSMDEQNEPLVLVITKKRELLINNTEIPVKNLSVKLAAIFENRKTKELFIQADQSVSYGFVARIMAEVKSSGITKVGLVTEAANSFNKEE